MNQRDQLFERIANELKIKVLQPGITRDDMKALIWSALEKAFSPHSDLEELETKLHKLSSYIWRLNKAITFDEFKSILKNIDNLENLHLQEND